ncbi:hypothetical protein N7456_007101 [Penicillium angulare]|uniref:Uncharacterized protein n=1 Tax=Penicillium angulare TaxID=116970 RepID=A0A9W9FIZ9_9EURO|nr:hypothetical protein N7456_007101 [Penicillium angulare]
MEGCITEISRTEAQFDEEESELSDEQRDSTSLCCALFRTASESLSTSQQYRRVRARNFLKDVYIRIGTEVLLLCTLTWSITKLSAFEPKEILPVLRQWWKRIPTKNGLKNAAKSFCNDNNIHELMKQTPTYIGSVCLLALFPREKANKDVGSANRKRTRLLKPAPDGTGQSPIQLARKLLKLISWLKFGLTEAEERSQSHGPVNLKIDGIPELQISLLSDQRPQSVFDLQVVQLMTFLQQYHPESASSEQLERILNLLDGYQSICPYIQLVYPWYGSLPSIEIKIDSKIGWSARVQLSHRLADELIKYIRNLTAGDVGNVGHRDSQQD